MSRLHPAAVYGLFKELRIAADDSGPLVLAGAPELVTALRKELLRDGGDAAAIRTGADVAGASALVWVLAAPPSEDDRRALRRAERARVPIVAVVAGPRLDVRVPYVLATDVARAEAGSGFPVDAIARILAHRLGERGTQLAERLPVLRTAVCAELIRRFSRQSALLGAAVFVPGADLPALTLKQLRLVLRIGAAHGVDVDAERLPEVLAVVGSGLALRAAARQALGAVPVAGWVVKGAVAYTGTRALGEAALRYFAARAAATRPGGASRAAS